VFPAPAIVTAGVFFVIEFGETVKVKVLAVPVFSAAIVAQVKAPVPVQSDV